MNARDDALHQAAADGNSAEIKRLVEEENYDPNQGDPESGLPSIATAAEYGRVAAMQTLIELGADLNYASPEYTLTLMGYAIEGGIEVIKFLHQLDQQKKFRFDPNELIDKENQSITALWKAASLQKWEIVRFFVEHTKKLNLHTFPTKIFPDETKSVLCLIAKDKQWDILLAILLNKEMTKKDIELCLKSPSGCGALISAISHQTHLSDSICHQFLVRYLLICDVTDVYQNNEQMRSQLEQLRINIQISDYHRPTIEKAIKNIKKLYTIITTSVLNESSISSFNDLPNELRLKIAAMVGGADTNDFNMQLIELFQRIHNTETRTIAMQKKCKLIAIHIVEKWQQAHLNFFFMHPNPHLNQFLRTTSNAIAELLYTALYTPDDVGTPWLHRYNGAVYSCATFPRAFISSQLIAHITAQITKLSPAKVNLETLKSAIDEALNEAMEKAVRKRNESTRKSETGENRKQLKRKEPENDNEAEKEKEANNPNGEPKTKKPRYQQLTLIEMWAQNSPVPSAAPDTLAPRSKTKYQTT